VRTTLNIDDDVIAAARELAAAGERRSLGSVISELARRGLTPARVEAVDGLPVIRVPAGAPPIASEMVRPIGVEPARAVLVALRAADGHRFLADDVSIGDADVPRMSGYRQVTDAHLLALARRRAVRLVTFDAGVLTLAEGRTSSCSRRSDSAHCCRGDRGGRR